MTLSNCLPHDMQMRACAERRYRLGPRAPLHDTPLRSPPGPVSGGCMGGGGRVREQCRRPMVPSCAPQAATNDATPRPWVCPTLVERAGDHRSKAKLQRERAKRTSYTERARLASPSLAATLPSPNAAEPKICADRYVIRLKQQIM